MSDGISLPISKNRKPQPLDLLVGIGLFATSFAFYQFIGSEVLTTPLLLSYNLALDYDPSRFVALWCERPLQEGELSIQFLVRHPLVLIARPVCLLLTDAGLSPQQGAMIISSASVAATAAILYCSGRTMDVSPHFAALIAVFWVISASALFAAAIPDAYSLAGIGLSLQFLLAAQWCQRGPPPILARILTGVLNFGITLTNVCLSVLSEGLLRWWQHSRLTTILKLQGLYIFAVGIIGTLVALTTLWIAEIENPAPIDAAKNLWWAANMPAQYRQSPIAVVGTFAILDSIAPEFSEIDIGTNENPSLMLDFRQYKFSPVGLLALAPLLAIMLMAAHSALKDIEFRPVWILALTWFVGNIMLHSYWQYRGSVFLYGVHAQIALIVLLLALGRRTPDPGAKGLVPTLLLISLIIPAAWNNLDRYYEMIDWLRNVNGTQ